MHHSFLAMRRSFPAISRSFLAIQLAGLARCRSCPVIQLASHAMQLTINCH